MRRSLNIQEAFKDLQYKKQGTEPPVETGTEPCVVKGKAVIFFRHCWLTKDGEWSPKMELYWLDYKKTESLSLDSEIKKMLRGGGDVKRPLEEPEPEEKEAKIQKTTDEAPVNKADSDPEIDGSDEDE